MGFELQTSIDEDDFDDPSMGTKLANIDQQVRALANCAMAMLTFLSAHGGIYSAIAIKLLNPTESVWKSPKVPSNSSSNYCNNFGKLALCWELEWL